MAKDNLDESEEEALPDYEEWDTIQKEISGLKRAAFSATNPLKKYNQFMNVIAAMLQHPFDDDIAWECPECGHVTDGEEFIQKIKEELDKLDLNRDEFDSLVGNREWDWQLVWNLHAAANLNDLIAVYARIAQRLVRDGLMMDKDIDTEEAVEDALDSIAEGDVPDDRQRPAQSQVRRPEPGRKKGGVGAK